MTPVVTNALKTKIYTALCIERKNKYNTDKEHAAVLGINPAQYSTFKNGKLDTPLLEAKWHELARRYNITTRPWVVVETPVFANIQAIIESCQTYSIGRIICDDADTGKTEAAQAYCRTHTGAVYIDCSQVKGKKAFIQQLCKEFGLDVKGTFAAAQERLMGFFKRTHGRVVVLDEVADLEYNAFLEIKRFWNASKGLCGWVLMGADGLEAKLERNRSNKKVGYAEIMRRMGGGYQRAISQEILDMIAAQAQTGSKVMPAKDRLWNYQAIKIAEANMPGASGTDIQRVVAKANGSYTRLYETIIMGI